MNKRKIALLLGTSSLGSVFIAATMAMHINVANYAHKNLSPIMKKQEEILGITHQGIPKLLIDSLNENITPATFSGVIP